MVVLKVDGNIISLNFHLSDIAIIGTIVLLVSSPTVVVAE